MNTLIDLFWLNTWGNNLKKSTYFRIGVASLCVTVINSPFSYSSNESGIAYLLGEFTGSFQRMLVVGYCLKLMKCLIKLNFGIK